MYVFDTNVLVAGLRSRNGASFLLLEAIARGDLEGLASVALMLEYQDVLARDEQLERFWASPEEVAVVLGMLAERLTPVSIHFSWRPQLGDPDDEAVLECAINGMARAIVTFNASDFEPHTARFGIEVMKPGHLVRDLNLVGRTRP